MGAMCLSANVVMIGLGTTNPLCEGYIEHHCLQEAKTELKALMTYNALAPISLPYDWMDL